MTGQSIPESRFIAMDMNIGGEADTHGVYDDLPAALARCDEIVSFVPESSDIYVEEWQGGTLVQKHYVREG